MTRTLANKDINSNNLNEIFNKLKSIYRVNEISQERKDYIINQINKYGYLPYPHIKALEELSPAEILTGVEYKLKLNNTYNDSGFCFDENNISAVKRANYTNASWATKEQHSIKLINLAGLGNGNKSTEAGKFLDWLVQLLILPSGNLDKGILSTTIYLIPFHPRDFGCAYLPTSSGVSEQLEDKNLKQELNLNAKEQVQLFITLSQLSGHPVMYDVLPQTGRFSKTILSNPHVARWFDIKELINKLNNTLNSICEELKNQFNNDDIECIKNIISNAFDGNYQDIPEHLKELESNIESRLLDVKKQYSNEMLLKEKQLELHKKAKKIINEKAGFDETRAIIEEDINNQGEIIGELIQNGLWPAPGGAWCSSGVPIFDKMSQGAGFPTFKHFDAEGNDVTHFANLDCQTPYYFVYLENGEFNNDVIDFYVTFLKKLQYDFNFDGFRVDHIDHIVDKVSEDSQQHPISYRAPRYVLGKANRALKNTVSHFACLAEYMLWDDFYYEYHQDMSFDILWGNDIISQYLKNTQRIAEDNSTLRNYNATLNNDAQKLSILKTYNNQDGEFRDIDQYPGQLSAKGALFKWFKFKFFPGGCLAQRPVLYIDGDESFTQRGIEKAIGVEESMIRENNQDFYKEFAAINDFTKNNNLTSQGIAEIIRNDNDGFVAWTVKKEFDADNERLLIVANQTPPTETVRNYENGELKVTHNTASPLFDKTLTLPEDFKIKAEFVFNADLINFTSTDEIANLNGNNLCFGTINPSEYHIYKIEK